MAGNIPGAWCKPYLNKSTVPIRWNIDDLRSQDRRRFPFRAEQAPLTKFNQWYMHIGRLFSHSNIASAGQPHYIIDMDIVRMIFIYVLYIFCLFIE